MMRLFPGLVRIPDVAFASWSRLPGRTVPTEPIPDLVPDLAVEVLSVSNTPREMERKLGEYFAAGVCLVWLIDPRQRTVQVFDAPSTSRTLQASDHLDGGSVLPGLAIPVADLFADLTPPG